MLNGFHGIMVLSSRDFVLFLVLLDGCNSIRM